MKKLFIFSFLIAVFSSCVSHFGLVSNQNQNQTSVQLSEKNFVVVGNVSAKSHANYFLGIGGVNREGLTAQARRKMTAKAGLEGKSRALINENTDYQTNVIFPFSQVKIITSATVVEFVEKASQFDSVMAKSAKVEIVSDWNESDLKEITPEYTNGILAGLRITPFGDYPSIIGGFKTEICWPGQSENFFLEPQFHMDYSPARETLNFIASIYAGYKTPFSQRTSFFAKAGLLMNYEVTSSYLETPGIGLATGLEFNRKYQAFLGFDIHASEYVSGPKIGFVYLF